MRARPSVLRGELVSERCGEEPTCLNSKEGLGSVGAVWRKEPVCLNVKKGSAL